MFVCAGVTCFLYNSVEILDPYGTWQIICCYGFAAHFFELCILPKKIINILNYLCGLFATCMLRAWTRYDNRRTSPRARHSVHGKMAKMWTTGRYTYSRYIFFSSHTPESWDDSVFFKKMFETLQILEIFHYDLARSYFFEYKNYLRCTCKAGTS